MLVALAVVRAVCEMQYSSSLNTCNFGWQPYCTVTFLCALYAGFIYS